MKRINISCILMIVVFAFAVGCSGGADSSDPIGLNELPDNSAEANHSEPSQINLWGYYDVHFDVETETVTAIPNRQVMHTVNAVKFLNEQDGTLEWAINSVEAGPGYFSADLDVSLTHPFPGLPQYNGYDVRGVFMGDGSAAFNYNVDLNYPISGNDQFMMADPLDGFGGPDGYTRWFNRQEFSSGQLPLVEYVPGSFATPGYEPDATLNPYKYFADALNPTENLWDFLNDHSDQDGVFSSGATNVRNYYLRFPNTKNSSFGYAVVANWGGLEPEFHPTNAPESLAIKVEDTNDLWFGDPTLFGGSLKLDISLWNWDAMVTSGVMDDYKIFIESTVLLSSYELTPAEMTPIGGGEHYSTYHVEIPADNTQMLDGNEYWVIAEQNGTDYTNAFGIPNLANTDPLAAFFRSNVSVSDVVPSWINVVTPNGGEQWNAGTNYNIEWTSQAVAGPVSIEYSTDNFVADVKVITASTENDGIFQWEVPEDVSSTVRVRITDTNDITVFDISDNDFSILERLSLTVLMPNGAEIFDVGTMQEITWTSTGAVSMVRIGYSKDNFVSDVNEIVASTENDGSFMWEVPNDPSSTVKIGIVDTSMPSVYDLSDADFTIKAEKPTITVTSPNGGEEWKVFSQHNITWTTTDIVDFVRIEYSKDNFVGDIHEIIASTDNDGVFSWILPNDPSETVRVRVTDTSDGTVSDVSDNDFTIEVKPIKVLAPNGGEIWIIDSVRNITWEADSAITALRIGYSKDNFVNDINEIVASTPNDGVFEWTIPNDQSSTVKVAIADASDPLVFDLSDNNFSISPVPPAESYWNQFMHDWNHGGRTTAVGPSSSNFEWTHTDGMASNNGTIVEGFDGTLYYGGTGFAVFGDLSAVNPDGSTKWIYTPPSPGQIVKPLGVSNDNSILYIGVNNDLFTSFNFGRIVGLNTSDGTEAWSYDGWDFYGWFNGTNYGLVTENGDLVTVIDKPNSTFGQNSIIRMDQFGGIVWERLIGFNWWSAPAQGLDGTIYVNVQAFFGLPKIIALNPDTGEKFAEYQYNWSQDPFGLNQTYVAVRPDGKVVFAAGNVGYCLNPDLSLDWSYQFPNSVSLLGAISIGPNSEIYAHSNSNLFAIGATGTPLWLQPYASNWMSPAIGGDGTIYVAYESGLAALNPVNGEAIWEYGDGPMSSPIIAHDGSVYAIEQGDLTKLGL